MSRKVHDRLLQLEKNEEDNIKSGGLLLSSITKEKITKDDDELGFWLVIVFCNWGKKHSETMTSREAHHCLLRLKKNNQGWWVGRLIIVFYDWRKAIKDDDELGSQFFVIFCKWGKKLKDNEKPPSSSSFFYKLRKKAKRWRQAKRLVIVSCNLRKTNIKVFFFGLQRMIMSWKAHHFLSFSVFI